MKKQSLHTGNVLYEILYMYVPAFLPFYRAPEYSHESPLTHAGMHYSEEPHKKSGTRNPSLRSKSVIEGTEREVENMRRIQILVLTLGLSLFAGTSTLFADGVLLVRPPAHPVATPLGVVYHRVTAEVHDGTAVTRIDQMFRNDYETDLEASYIFPIPEEAAITEFALYVNGNRMSGEVLDREQARQVYEQIVREMRDPGLLEYVGRNLFRARVYPVPARGRTRVELEYTETLHYDAGMFRYRYPLDTERFSPTPLDEVTITAHISSSVPLKSVYSPSHAVDILKSSHSASVGYEARGVKPDRDFTIYYTVSEHDLGMNLLAFRKDSEPGHFLLMLSPGDLEGRRQSKDIIFVLDTSGSMNGEKIQQAQSALGFCIDSLDVGDRFNIVQFATGITAFHEGFVPARGEKVKEAHRFIGRMQARGGTNIHDALITALDMFDVSGGEDGQGPRMVVFLTDGEPTVGVTDLQDIIGNVGRANRHGARVFVFGVGNDVNTHLLDSIAEENRGISEYVRPGENIEVQVSSFFRKVSEPVLADIKLDFGKITVSDIVPLALPDIFRGTQLIVLGRYEGSGLFDVTLRGKVDGREVFFTHEGTFPKENLSNDFIPRLWATRKIGYLMGQIRLNGEKEELVEEIVRLSKEYGIMTPYTSFLILEREADYQDFGLEPTAELKSRGAGFKEAMGRKKGEDAVRSSMDISALRESRTLSDPVVETVKWVGHKTFYLRDGFWVDAEYQSGMRAKEITYLSREYFDLLSKRPELGPYFALSGNVVVVLESTCYRVVQK